MSRDFILILGGGVVSLMTTLVVLFVSDYIYRRDELLYRKALPPPALYAQPAENSEIPSDGNVEETDAVSADESAATTSTMATEVEAES